MQVRTEDFMDQEALGTSIGITRGTFRLIHHLLVQAVTKKAVEVARKNRSWGKRKRVSRRVAKIFVG